MIRATDDSARGHGRPISVITRHPLLSIWVGWSLFLLLAGLGRIIHFNTQDPDDFMRLLEVRDLLAGQGWYDVTQYRMNPPMGAEMHWSRLVDIPIALALLIGRLVLTEPNASKFAMIVVPLGQLLFAMWLIRGVMVELRTDRRHQLIAIAILPLFPVLIDCFAPMRIDHHGWQGIATLGCAYFFLRAPDDRAAVFGGGIAALWLSISLEALPMVVALAALYGLRFMLFSERSVALFMAGLAGASWLSFVATRPASEFMPHCDTIGWPHLAAFTLAAVLIGTAVMWRGGSGSTGVAVRAAVLGLIGALVAPVIILPIGPCAINPFAMISPVMETYWHGVIMEGLPITKQIISVRIVLLWGPLVVLFAAWLGLPDRHLPLARRGWFWLAAVALCASLTSLLVMREVVNAEILTIPFAALLIARFMPRVRAIGPMLPRVLATGALPLVATPTLASALFKPMDGMMAEDARAPFERFMPKSAGEAGACNFNRLAVLPPSMLFATLDLGPEILVKTRHWVVSSGYHRNMAKMREVVDAFSGDPVRAQGIVRANHARFVVLCTTAGDTAVFRARRPDNLANRLVSGKAPPWLHPVPGLDRGKLRVYQVDPSRMTWPLSKRLPAGPSH